MMDLDWGTQRIINMYIAWRKQWSDSFSGFGMRSVRELADAPIFLMHLDYTERGGGRTNDEQQNLR